MKLMMHLPRFLCISGIVVETNCTPHGRGGGGNVCLVDIHAVQLLSLLFFFAASPASAIEH